MRQHLPKLPPKVKAIFASAFPAYRGRKWYIQTAETVNARSYWDGGSRDYFVFVRLADGAIMPAPTSHPIFDKVSSSCEHIPLVPGLACVRRAIFCGKESGLTLILHSDDANPKLLGA